MFVSEAICQEPLHKGASSLPHYIMSSIADIPLIWVHALSLLVLLLHTICIGYMPFAIEGGDEGWHNNQEKEKRQTEGKKL